MVCMEKYASIIDKKVSMTYILRDERQLYGDIFNVLIH